MREDNGTRNWNSRVANPFLHHNVDIGPLSHQEKIPGLIMWGTYLIGHNWTLRKNAISWLREVVGS